jgi:hypothetical protein
MARSREQRDALLTIRRIADAIIATVNENPHGAPAGPMYAAVMQYLSPNFNSALEKELLFQ